MLRPAVPSVAIADYEDEAGISSIAEEEGGTRMCSCLMGLQLPK